MQELALAGSPWKCFADMPRLYSREVGTSLQPGDVLVRYGKLLFILLFVLCAVAAFAAKTPALKTADCLACHSDAVDEAKYKASIHGSMFECTDCHKDIKAAGPHEPAPKKPECASCHADAVKAYDNSVHGKAVAAGRKDAATCLSCHGSPHEILPASDPKSKISHQNIPGTCATCHGQKMVMERTGLSSQPYLSYQESVHGKAVAGGSDKAAVCTDCHGNHEILGPGDPKSPIFKFNVPQTCAKCHPEEKAKYTDSIHGQAIARGNWQSPVCTDCHGIHMIRGPKDPKSPVSAQQLAKLTCGRCHEQVRLTQEFGVPGNRVSTYMSSYHGLAVEGGSTIAANCASCHGAHDILPSSDPRSTIAQANLVTTCGKCHQGASANFVKGKIHIEAPLSADVGSIWVKRVRMFYLAMIFATIGGMVLHNFLAWLRKARAKKQAQRRIVVRMDNAQRFQHLTLLISFITLVITGFALKYPDSWFAQMLHMSEGVRGIVHRVAGVILIAGGVFHVVYLATSRGGRKMLFDMLPEPKDAMDVVQALGYYLGFTENKPKFKRFGYAEKAEYWALIWGTVVMAVTGLALWFKVLAGIIGPRWLLDVATAIHFYEAILATLAIVVWHFYAVIFDPDAYPMNWAWYDGKMDIEMYHHEHELDYQTVGKSIEAAAQKEEAAPAKDEEAQTATPSKD
jgi:cytochrome b subunit of formate dehydrogenase